MNTSKPLNWSVENTRQLNLPIAEVIDELMTQVSRQSNVILQAEPGAGKTSMVPLCLLTHLNPKKKILLLQPRRIAARNAAYRLAELINEPVGKRIGYRVRNDAKVSSETRIEVITEGILIRMLQSDPELSQVSLIIFDEFHERSLDSDLSLAFCLEVQQTLRDDLKLLVMSATLEHQNLSQLMMNCPVLLSAGRSYPVTIDYVNPNPRSATQSAFDRMETWKSLLVSAVSEVMTDDSLSYPGILIFLPGVAEIHQAAEILKATIKKHPNYQLVEFYGDMPFEQQQHIFRADATQPRIILSTNIAETSVTIDGIGAVIDTGLMKQSVFDPNVGFNRLHKVRVSKASATQRAGRAGRLSAGRCIRLWNESEKLREQNVADIQREDLASFALELALWGISQVNELKLLDYPNPGALEQARALLKQLNGLDEANRITARGKLLQKLPVHPRLASMLLYSIERDCMSFGCLIAAMIEQKDIFKGEARLQPDFYSRLVFVLDQIGNRNQAPAIRRLLTDAKKLFKQLSQLNDLGGIQSQATQNQANQNQAKSPQKSFDDLFKISKNDFEKLEQASFLLAIAFPDRIAQPRGQGYKLANGSGAIMDAPLSNAPRLVVAVVMGGHSKTSKIFQAIELSENALESHFTEHIVEKTVTQWDTKSQSVKASVQRCYYELVLSESPIKDVDAALVTEALLQGIRQNGLPWDEHSKSLLARINRLRQLPQFAQEFPDFSEAYLLNNLSEWLAPFIQGLTKLSQVTAERLNQALMAKLDWTTQQKLEQLMPVKLKVASGSQIKIDYVSADKPILAVKLQEMFAEKQTPCVANGQIKVVIHLLSPAGRPLAITEDLASFWANAYQEVKKQMKGRYPKHPWPDDPLSATATRHTKKRANKSGA